MNIHTKPPAGHRPSQPAIRLTIDDFLAFTDTRPQEERWELIEGRPVLNPSPVQSHQVVASNISTYLMNHKEASGATWTPLLGVGTRVPVSPDSLPQPDVYVQAGAAVDSAITDDAIVIFEVLSRSNSKKDQAWRRKVYGSVPNCRHYVTVSLKVPVVCAFDADTGWKKRCFKSLADSLDLPAIGVSLPLRFIYRWTLLAVSQ